LSILATILVEGGQRCGGEHQKYIEKLLRLELIGEVATPEE
jgi:hypothetical protein